MTKTKRKSKHQSDSESSSSSSNSPSESDKQHKLVQKESNSRHTKGDGKSSKSIWDSPRNQAQTSKYDEKRRERKRSRDEEDRDSSRHRSQRDDDRRNDYRGRRSPDRRDDARNNRKSPQERRRYDDSRDSRNNRKDDDRRKRSDSRERPQQSNRRGGGFNKQRRFNDKEEDEGNFEWGKRDAKNEPDEEPVEKDKPNFGLSGKLTEETNKVHGIVIKYAEPPEAKKPKRRWRLYPFKGETALQTLYIHRQSAFLIGRDRKICDIAVDHPSCSKQHAALQYRLVPYEREDGSTGKRVRPYIIDLESANGTFVNNNQIEAKKFVELLEKDVIKFGFSSREYVLLHEASKDEAEDDEVADDAPEPTAQPAN